MKRLYSAIKRVLIATVLSLGILPAASASGVTVQASLDSVSLLMGMQTPIHVRIVEPAATNGVLAARPESALTEAIEIAAVSEGDTTDLGNGMREIMREIIIQSFDSGDYVIPPVRYIVGTDTFSSNELALRVIPVDVSQMETINPQADIEKGTSKWFDFLPDWLIDYWGWILAAIIIIAVAVVLYLMFKKKAIPMPMRKPRPKPSPYEVAISELTALKGEDLCASGREKEYYTRLTDILRVYLQNRFNINAMEMTTSQITRAVNSNAETRPSESLMRTILEVADFVKFAKVRPLPEDNVRSFNNALKFVEDTKPLPLPENEPGKSMPAKP